LNMDDAICQLKSARDGFWFSLGAYSLLRKEPASSQLSRYDIKLYEDGDIVVSEGSLSERRGTNYTIGFNSSLNESAARSVVENSFRQMIIDSNQVFRAYAKASGFDVSKIPVAQFIRHYRNAVAHNGHWDLRSSNDLPLTWRNRTITIDMNNQPIDGFLTWFEGLQLCAQLNILISEHTKQI